VTASFDLGKKADDYVAMYVLPRALESAWSSARKRAWVPIVPFGETILGAAAMAMVMDAYKVGNNQGWSTIADLMLSINRMRYRELYGD